MASKWQNILSNDGLTVFNWEDPQRGVSPIFAGRILLEATAERYNIRQKDGASAYSDAELSSINRVVDLLLNKWEALFSKYRNLNSSDLDTWDASFSENPPINPQLHAVEQIELYTGVNMELIKNFYINGGVYAVLGIFADVDFLKYAYHITSSMKEIIKEPVRGGYVGASSGGTSPAAATNNYNGPGVRNINKYDENYIFGVSSSTPPTGISTRKYYNNSNRYEYFHRPFHLGTTAPDEGALIAGLDPYMHGTVSDVSLAFSEPTTFRAFNTGYENGQKISLQMPLNSDGTSYTNSFYKVPVSTVLGDIIDTYELDTQEGFRVDHNYITYYVDDDQVLDYYTP